MVQKQNLLNFPDFQGDLISSQPFSATARNSRLQQSSLIELGITLPCKVDDFSVLEMQNDFGFSTQQVTKEKVHMIKNLELNHHRFLVQDNGFICALKTAK